MIRRTRRACTVLVIATLVSTGGIAAPAAAAPAAAAPAAAAPGAAAPAAAPGAVAPGAGPAGAATLAGRAAQTLLILSLTADAGWARAVLLRCQPPSGGHPAPGRACAALRRAGGDPARLPEQPGMCTLEFAPVTAEATGQWRGEPVNWSRTFGNLCELRRATAVVFDF